MKKYLLTLEEIIALPDFNTHDIIPVLELERHLMREGIEPVPDYYMGVDTANGPDVGIIIIDNNPIDGNLSYHEMYLKAQESSKVGIVTFPPIDEHKIIKYIDNGNN